MTRELTTLPFRPEFDPKIADGSKTATARSKRYGLPGDRLQTRVGVVVLDSVEQVPLGVVAQQHYAVEGCKTPSEFVAIWWRIHPRVGYDPEKVVWFHRFHLEAQA